MMLVHANDEAEGEAASGFTLEALPLPVAKVPDWRFLNSLVAPAATSTAGKNQAIGQSIQPPGNKAKPSSTLQTDSGICSCQCPAAVSFPRAQLLPEDDNAEHARMLAPEERIFLATTWQSWQQYTRSQLIRTANDAYAVIWLEESVEKNIDAHWALKPSQAFLLHCVALTLCMQPLARLLPQLAQHGCAPLPFFEAPLCAALRRLGLLAAGATNHALCRSYAVLTYFPFRGGCAMCSLRKRGQRDFANTPCASSLFSRTIMS